MAFVRFGAGVHAVVATARRWAERGERLADACAGRVGGGRGVAGLTVRCYTLNAKDKKMVNDFWKARRGRT